MASDIFEKLQQGIQHQHKHEFLAAEELYRQILEEHPDHPDALHLLGVLAYQIGDYDVAEDLIRHAIDSDHAIADYHNNLGEVLRVTGRLDEARQHYQQALSLDPEHENALMNMDKLDQPQAANEPLATDAAEFIPDVRQYLPSYLLSADDESSLAEQSLIDLSLLAAHKASKMDLQAIASRFPEKISNAINVWPGEHYRLLAALVDALKPGLVITIGTSNGASVLSMKASLPANGKIITYDRAPWSQHPDSGLVETDFDVQLQHKLIDLRDPVQVHGEQGILQQADIIVVESIMDKDQVYDYCQLFDILTFKKPPLIIFDNTRVLSMLKTWREISHPKLDLTSFGHWTGTGLVEWK
jgi:tetratricopeptide (TPR) repeat protein